MTAAPRTDVTAEGLYCPNNHGPLAKKKEVRKHNFRGVEIEIISETYQCKECQIEAGTQEQASKLQIQIADAYRKKKGLLSGKDIRECRKDLGMTQQELALKIGVGLASIKRWEAGALQTPAMDNLLREALKCQTDYSNPLTGNKQLSLARVKLLILEFEKLLGRKLLIEGDKLLFTAKYAFYADMLAYNKLGKSITGATYSALPHGPQLNNYVELVEEIIAANESEADPLDPEEKAIIEKIAKKWPRNWDVFNASHREKIVKNKQIGTHFFYTDAKELTEITD